ncbi:MAG: hypothetical protein ACREDF_11870, partial [Thermoplasmata archaeon]
MPAATRRRLATCAIAALLAIPSPAVAQVSEPFSPPAALLRYDRDRTYDLLHLRLDITIDPGSARVWGTATNVIAPLVPGRALDTVEFDAAELQIEEVRLIAGEPARRVMEEGSSLPEGESASFDVDGARDRLIVRLDGAASPIAVMIRYSARPRGGLYFSGPDPDYPDRPYFVYSQGETEDNHFWFPSYDFPDDRATSAVSVT